MNSLEELAAQRREFLAALAKNKGINLDIFDDFYPDEAHFIYELLQNAEDTGATEVMFELSDFEVRLRAQRRTAVQSGRH